MIEHIQRKISVDFNSLHFQIKLLKPWQKMDCILGLFPIK